MTRAEKSDLMWKVRYYLGAGKAPKEIVQLLSGIGFQKQTIRNYIRVCSK